MRRYSSDMKTGVIGASGYAGGELLRLISSHPNFELSYIAAGSSAGELITSVHPQLQNFAGQKFAQTNTNLANACELLFIALPHGESAKLVSQLDSSVKIIDLGADFRLADSNSWTKYYGGDHAGTWPYGLPELTGGRENIASSTRVANPGCYATAIALAISPAIESGLVASDDVVVVAASGTTGAGRSAKINLIGSEVMNSLTSYKFGGVHQHTPEIEESLSRNSKGEVKVSFTPILAPMPRGILATVTVKLTGELNTAGAQKIYSNYYHDSAFVTILEAGALPATSSVTGTNNVQIQVAVDSHSSRLIVSCAIDNLGKGAAGQAIQNANLICGLPESTGLNVFGVK